MFKIKFSDDFYYANNIADVTFYLDVDGQSFPDDQWTDFAVIVLNWWISAILENRQKENAEFKFFFMDGPYYVNCSKHGENVHMTCIADKKQITAICECNIEFDELVHELIDASSSIIRSVERLGLEKMSGFNDLKKSLKLLSM